MKPNEIRTEQIEGLLISEKDYDFLYRATRQLSKSLSEAEIEIGETYALDSDVRELLD